MEKVSEDDISPINEKDLPYFKDFVEMMNSLAKLPLTNKLIQRQLQIKNEEYLKNNNKLSREVLGNYDAFCLFLFFIYFFYIFVLNDIVQGMIKIQEVSIELVNATAIVKGSREALYSADDELYKNTSEISRKHRRKERLIV